MFAGTSLIITILATRLKEQERGQQVIDILVVVKPKGLDLLSICLIRMLMSFQ